MNVISAAETLERLRALGHDYNPEKQLFKASVAGSYVQLFDPNSLADDGGAATAHVKACDIEQYLAKGFLIERPSVSVTGVAKPQRTKAKE